MSRSLQLAADNEAGYLAGEPHAFEVEPLHFTVLVLTSNHLPIGDASAGAVHRLVGVCGLQGEVGTGSQVLVRLSQIGRALAPLLLLATSLALWEVVSMNTGKRSIA
jgi:hypothetical protein